MSPKVEFGFFLGAAILYCSTKFWRANKLREKDRWLYLGLAVLSGAAALLIALI